MEGWLQVPPERNLIGRPLWKNRYVRLAHHSKPSTPTSRDGGPTIRDRRDSSAPVSPKRPVTSESQERDKGGVSGGIAAAAAITKKIGLERSQSTHLVSTLWQQGQKEPAHETPGWSLAVYKQKDDSEPVARYPLNAVGSCYIGDVASRGKKSIVLPTLILHLRPDTSSPASSTSLAHSASVRSFRRRSHEAHLAKDISKRDNNSGTTLLFRPLADDQTSLEKWARELQNRIAPSASGPPAPLQKSHTSMGVGTEGDHRHDRERRQESDSVPSTPLTHSSGSVFLLNGEPNTTLLSPSLRSKASNLSSIDSKEEDRQSYMNSPTSDVAPARQPMDERPNSRSAGEYTRSSLSFARPFREADGSSSPARPRGSISSGPSSDRERQYSSSTSGRRDSDATQDSFSSPNHRRETILDRFFADSLHTVPESRPQERPEPAKLSSVARFEALMRELEEKEHSIPEPPREAPHRIPSPTQRALRFISTGERSRSPPGARNSDEVSDASRSTLVPSRTASTPKPEMLSPAPTRMTPDFLSTPRAYSISPSASRRNSDELSVKTTTSSSAGGGNTYGLSLEPAPGIHAKRHSLAGFEMMGSVFPRDPGGVSGNIALATGTGKRGSWGEVAGMAPGSASVKKVEDRVGRGLFREFSF